MDTRIQILKAAENIFGAHGYGGASMRQIAEEAGVPQSLLHYHFKNKENLYAAIFDQRSSEISSHRGVLLDELMARPAKPSLEEVLSVLMTPTHRVAEASDTEVQTYVQLVAQLGLASDERSTALVAKYFDPVAFKFIDVFRQLIPGLTPARAVWCYLFAIGSRTEAHALNGRVARLARALGSAVEDPVPTLIAYTAAAIRGLANAQSQGS